MSEGEFGASCPIATVCVVIQGGPGTLDTAASTVRQGTPLVVVEGSGQAADVIAYAYKLQHNQGKRGGMCDSLSRVLLVINADDRIQPRRAD